MKKDENDGKETTSQDKEKQNIAKANDKKEDSILGGEKRIGVAYSVLAALFLFI